MVVPPRLFAPRPGDSNASGPTARLMCCEASRLAAPRPLEAGPSAAAASGLEPLHFRFAVGLWISVVDAEWERPLGGCGGRRRGTNSRGDAAVVARDNMRSPAGQGEARTCKRGCGAEVSILLCMISRKKGHAFMHCTCLTGIRETMRLGRKASYLGP